MTTAVRSLRLSRQLTLSELALLTGISARTIAEIEHGLRRMDPEIGVRLAGYFGLTPERLSPMTPPVPLSAADAARQRAAALALAALAGASLLLPLHVVAPDAALPVVPRVAVVAPAAAEVEAQIADSVRLPTAQPFDMLPSPAVGVVADYLAQRQPLAPALLRTSEAAVPVQPRFEMTAAGPRGCPLALGIPLVITQGFDVGTHAPADVWGALDLVFDNQPIFGAQVIATHDGIAHIYPDTWPGGNVVMVYHPSGWTTLYAHLSAFAVTDGQAISAGSAIGAVGDSGMTSGPHLHYEVRSPGGAGNIDPTPLLTCS